ncbi:MAG: TasA family protein [Gaiellaceae bacterium]
MNEPDGSLRHMGVTGRVELAMDWHSDRGGDAATRVRILDRLSALVAHPKRILVAIVALLVAAGAAVGSSAVLSSSSTNPGNSFQASNLDVSNGGNNAVISVSGMHPGDNTQGDVTITNTGDIPVSTMDLSSAVIAHTEPNTGQIASALTLTITDTTSVSTQVYSGPATPMTTDPLRLPGDPVTPADPWSAGEARTYHFQLSLPNNTGNTFQLSTATIRYTWTASQ